MIVSDPVRIARVPFGRRITRRAVAGGTAAFGALMLAACGGVSSPAATGDTTSTRPQSGPPKKIVFSKKSASEKDVAWRRTFDIARQAINVEVELMDEPGAEYWDKRQAEFAGGTASADVMVNQLNWVLLGGLRGMFVDLNPLFRRDKVDTSQYYQADFKSWSWKDKLWALTFQAGGEAVLYNKELFQAKGVKLPHKNWTYDDLLQACLKLNDPANGKFALEIGQNGLQYMMGTFVRNFGGKVLNEERNKALYGDDPKSIEGASLDVDLHTKYQVTPAAEALKSLPKGARPIEVQMVAMEINGFGRHVNIRKAIGNDNLDFAPPPKGPTGIQQVRVAGNSWSLLKLSKEHDAAWKVLKWLHTKEGLISPQLEALAWPPLVWAAKSPQWIDQFKGTRIDDLQDVWRTGGHNQVVLPEGDIAIKAMNDPMARAVKGEITTRDAMRESADALNTLFAQRPKEWN